MKVLLRGTPQEQLPFSKVQNPAQTSLPPQDAWFHRASRRRRRARRVAARSTQAPGAAHLSRRPAGGRLLPARYPARAVLAGGRRGAGTCFATAVPAFHPAGTRGGRGPTRGDDVGVDAEAVRFDLRDLYATAAAGDREAAMGFYAEIFSLDFTSSPPPPSRNGFPPSERRREPSLSKRPSRWRGKPPRRKGPGTPSAGQGAPWRSRLTRSGSSAS